MHAIRPGALWRAAPAAGQQPPAPSLRVRADKQIRAGRTATVRWSGASGVARWTIELDGRRVATLRANDPRVLRKRMRSPGRHRWRVLGRDGAGARIVAATRSFRVVRAR
jgi:hypothetical protein